MRREYTANAGVDLDGTLHIYECAPISDKSIDLGAEVKKPFYIKTYSTKAIVKITTSSATPAIFYSFDNANWNASVTPTTSTPIEISMGNNLIVYFKCKEAGVSFKGVKFTSSGLFDVGGNILSLVHPTNWVNPTLSILQDSNFANMFLNNKNIQHAERLCLGATSHLGSGDNGNPAVSTYGGVTDAFHPYSVTSNVFNGMFKNSTLITAPQGLGAVNNNGAKSHYEMFYNCVFLRRCSRMVRGYYAGQQAFAYCFGFCPNVEYLPMRLYGAFANAGKQFEGFLRHCHRIRFPHVDDSTLIFARGDTMYNAPSESCRYMLSYCYSLDRANIHVRGDSTSGMQANAFGQFFDQDMNLKHIYYKISAVSSWMNSSSHANWVQGVSSNGTFQYSTPSTVSVSYGNSGVPTGWTAQAV